MYLYVYAVTFIQSLFSMCVVRCEQICTVGKSQDIFNRSYITVTSWDELVALQFHYLHAIWQNSCWMYLELRPMIL